MKVKDLEKVVNKSNCIFIAEIEEGRIMEVKDFLYGFQRFADCEVEFISTRVNYEHSLDNTTAYIKAYLVIKISYN